MIKNTHSTFWALFLINPFVLFLFSLYRHRAKWAPNALWAFIVFYGFTFALSTESQGSDILHYISLLEYFHSNIASFGEAYSYFKASGNIDFISYFISYLISRFTASQAILTASYALIFGLFYSRNIFYLFRQLEGKLHRWTWILIALYILVVPFWEINGFRFWTATHVFLYGILPFLIEGKKKSLWFCALSFIFHFSFILPNLVLLLYLFVPKKMMIGLGFFLLTFIYREIDIQWINSIMNMYAPSIFVERTDVYLGSEEINRFRTTAVDKNWYVIWYKKGLSYALALLLAFTVLKSRKWLDRIPELYRLLFFTLLLFGIANIASSLPSGGRFISLALLLGVFSIALFFQNHYRGIHLKVLLTLVAPVFILFIIVSIRIGLYSISIETILSNPIFAILSFGDTLSINDLLK